jgi:SAM-dependent methyltransferase
MGRLGDSFRRVSADYDRGRPRYPAAAVEVMLEGLPAPADVVDVGAGTGQLSEALLGAGAHVTAVEPGAQPRELLEARLAGRASVLDSTAEDLPLVSESVDLIVCADSFHWLDAERALAEFRRLLRAGGRLCVSGLTPRWEPSAWAAETGALIGPLWARADHPLRASGFAVPEVPAGFGFEEVSEEEIPFVLETDRDGLLALFGSWSAVAALPEDERSEVRARLAEILDRHAVGEASLAYVAHLRLYTLKDPA